MISRAAHEKGPASRWRFRPSPTSNASSAEDIENRPLLLSPSKSSTRAVRWYKGFIDPRRLFEKRHAKHHRHNDSIRVNVPVRMMLSTLAVFVILPLSLFTWKEFHMQPKEVMKQEHHPQAQESTKEQPQWLEEGGDAPIPTEGNVTATDPPVVTESKSLYFGIVGATAGENEKQTVGETESIETEGADHNEVVSTVDEDQQESTTTKESTSTVENPDEDMLLPNPDEPATEARKDVDPDIDHDVPGA